jgi:hypothetical protein
LGIDEDVRNREIAAKVPTALLTEESIRGRDVAGKGFAPVRAAELDRELPSRVHRPNPAALARLNVDMHRVTGIS